MDKNQYVAYVSTYTMQNDVGIHIYDVDVKHGTLTEKDTVRITNSSYLTISHNGKYMYAITDFAVDAFKVLPDGCLKLLNHASINGMRGCYLSTDYDDKLLFVAGFHDAKITVLRIKKDGSVGEILDEIYHQGLGSIVERNFMPHVCCVKMTRDNKYLCATDSGMDQVKIYAVNHTTGKLKLVDMIHCEQDSSPRYIKFHKSGKFAYVIHELSCTIDVYEYSDVNNNPEFTKIQTVSTLNDYHTSGCLSYALKFSGDHKLLMCSIAGDNSIGIFKINAKTGMLTKCLVLPISGDYPKDIAIFPDGKHVLSLNHESNTMTFFELNPEAGTIVMSAPEMKVPKGNCVIMKKLDENKPEQGQQ